MGNLIRIGRCDCCGRTKRLRSDKVKSRIAPVMLQICSDCLDCWCEPVDLFNRVYPTPYEGLEDWVMLIPLFVNGKYISVDDLIKQE